MRIASLVPSATEIVFTLGLGDDLVAVTHECDWPPTAASLPQLTRTVVPEGLSTAEIDRRVRETVADGRPLYELDADRLEELEPDLILAQAVCEVCAVSYEDVVEVAARLPHRPRVLSLDPMSLDDVLGDLRRVGEAAGAEAEARMLLEQARRRIKRVGAAVQPARRPRVAALEWLEPPFVAGHWVPEMIELAGGRDVLGVPAEKSRTVDWRELESAACEVAIVMPCGYDAERATEEVHMYGEHISRLGADRVIAVDASAYFSRPGPRLVTGIELLGHVLHPGLVEAPIAHAHAEMGAARRT